MKKSKIYLIVLSILLVVISTACAKNNGEDQKDFSNFTKNLFIKEVQSDSITLNYMLSNPSAYGITNFTPTLGDYGIDYFNKMLQENEALLKELESFKYESLSKSQQLTYDILKEYLQTELSAKDVLLYPESLSPTIGTQAQLPVLLAEFNFYSKEDIDSYIALLSDVKNYFTKLVEFEKVKSENGLFMSDFAVDDIIKQCSDFISEPENNFLMEVFNDKVDALDYLTSEEKTSYKAQNKDGVLNFVIPAYGMLIEELNKLKGTGTNNGGLSNLPKGKEYYEYLVKSSTGSSKNINAIIKKLESTITVNSLKMSKVMKNNPEVLEQASAPTFCSSDPEEIISILKENIVEDYPECPPVNHTIKYVHESLQESLSPAFYLTPPIDNYTNNVIYINKGENTDMSQIFTTIAHEGYPGHLYQTVYFHSVNPDEIRQLISFGGYVEGWATYVEHSSYYWAGLDEDVASLLEQNLSIVLCIYSRVDVGINYEGWDLAQTTQYLNTCGITDDKVIYDVYKSMIEEPANYLKYCLGFLEFTELKNKASESLGSKFILKDFNEFLLKTGPAQFYVIDKYLDKWLKEQ